AQTFSSVVTISVCRTPRTSTTLLLPYTSLFRSYEAEQANFSGPVVSTKHPGFTGTGYLDFQNSNGDFVQWTVSGVSAGTHTMDVRFANGSGATISVRVTVNGVNLSTNLSMPCTGANWEVWTIASSSGTLNA